MRELSVSTLLRYLKNKLDTDEKLQKISVSGEISNYHRHFSGHLYFTLKDEYAAISCVMFKSAAVSLRFEPKNGDKVLVYANTSIFESSGQLQLYVLKMEQKGAGDLFARYEELKKHLSEAGKFDPAHKIPLSVKYPDKVAVLVGEASAAMSDIRITFSRRWPLTKVDFYPVLVQGESAPADIMDRLQKVDAMGYDAIILARGGGSFEDLFCFNDENLINTIYDLKTFIITGIGHEQDFTLADFAADLRAATPTASVELITPNISDVRNETDDLYGRLLQAILDRLDYGRMNCDYLLERLSYYQKTLHNITIQIDADTDRIRQNILYRIASERDRTDHLLSEIRSKADFKLNEQFYLHKRLHTLLEAYSCKNVLKRGYTLIIQDGKVIKSKRSLKHSEFDIHFADGILKAIERDTDGTGNEI